MPESRPLWPPVRASAVAGAFGAGIAISAWSGGLADAPVPWAVAAVLVVLAIRWRRVAPAVRALAVLAVAALVAGALAARERAAAPRLPAGVIADDRSDDAITGIVAGPMLAAPGRVSFVVDLDGPADARVLVTVEPPIAAAVQPGDRVRVGGRLRTPRGLRNPGGVDRRQVVGDRGGQLELNADHVTVIERDAALTPWRAAARAHRAATAAIAARGGDPAGNAIVRAAVIGDRSAVPEEVDQRWRAAGIYHALSVSGLHLAVVAMLLFVAVRRAWASVPGLAMRIDAARIAAAVAAPAAIAYTLATGGQTATLRALVVVLAVLGGVALRRRLVVLDAVGLAALAILVQRPSALFDPSFQLSFAAAVTMCVTARRADDELVTPPATRLGRALRRLARWATSALRASLWVTATTAPITAWHFHQVAVGGIAGNLVLAPLVELLVIPAGLAGLVLSGLGGPGGALLDLAIATAALTDRLAGVLAAWLPVFEVSPPRPAEIVAWLAILGGVLALRDRRHRRRGVAIAIAGAAVLAASLTWSFAIEPPRRSELRITFLDVGQGDAAVIELPGGAVWLVDAGGLPIVASPELTPADAARLQRSPGEAIVRFLAHRRIHRIDVALISHPHPDHYLGLLALADRIPIGELWIARPAPDDEPPIDAPAGMPRFEQVVAMLEAAGTRVVHAPLGVARRGHGVTLEVLGPIYDDGTGPAPVAASDPVRSLNDDSLVIAVGFAGRRVLFLGDIEREGEDLLVAADRAAADVVKVAHHGSATSSTAELVAAAAARWAIVSCGRANRFGFPAPDVVARWQAAGATVVRTDQAGAVTVIVDPDGRVTVDGYD